MVSARLLSVWEEAVITTLDRLGYRFINSCGLMFPSGGGGGCHTVYPLRDEAYVSHCLKNTQIKLKKNKMFPVIHGLKVVGWFIII